MFEETIKQKYLKELAEKEAVQRLLNNHHIWKNAFLIHGYYVNKRGSGVTLYMHRWNEKSNYRIGTIYLTD